MWLHNRQGKGESGDPGKGGGKLPEGRMYYENGRYSFVPGWK